VPNTPACARPFFLLEPNSLAISSRLKLSLVAPPSSSEDDWTRSLGKGIGERSKGLPWCVRRVVTFGGLNFMGSKLMVLAKKKSKSKANFNNIRSPRKRNGFAACVHGSGFDTVVGRAYRIMDDPDAVMDGWVRVIDESGEDYLYPTSWFIPIQLEKSSERRLSIALRSARASEAAPVRRARL
jgi:hypothetical protein